MKIFFFIFYLIFWNCLFGQSFVFIVVGGEVQFEEKNTWKKAISGTTLPDGSKIKLSKESYAVLYYQNKQTLELKTEGNYSYNDLINNIVKTPSPLTSKYVEKMIQNLKNRNLNKSIANKNLQNNIQLFQPPTQSFILEDILTFVWSAHKNAKDYIFILSHDGKEIIKKETKDTLITLNLQPFQLKTNECYYWQVFAKGNEYLKSSQYCIKIFSNSEKDRIFQEIQSIQNDLGNTNLAKVVLANYYEDKKLLVEAYSMYKQAAESGIEDYKILRENFIDKFISK